MKAVICKTYGPPENLVLEDVEPLKPGRGQVVVSVKACGVNFPDTLIIQGLYQFKPSPPFSPGGEVAGIVKEVGAGVERVKPGDRVIAFSAYGGFAEEMLAEAGGLIPMPAAMDFDTAASFVMTYGTDIHALKDRAHLRPGETLLGWLQAGKLKPCISARYSLERAADALNDILQRKVTGKTVLVVHGEEKSNTPVFGAIR